MTEILITTCVLLFIALCIALFLYKRANQKKIDAIDARQDEVMRRQSCEKVNEVLTKQAEIVAKPVSVQDAYQGLKDE
jgi:signal-transduction protein with cAMP-binding, CBS, and nucleotidyltransferase domain